MPTIWCASPSSSGRGNARGRDMGIATLVVVVLTVAGTAPATAQNTSPAGVERAEADPLTATDAGPGARAVAGGRDERARRRAADAALDARSHAVRGAGPGAGIPPCRIRRLLRRRVPCPAPERPLVPGDDGRGSAEDSAGAAGVAAVGGASSGAARDRAERGEEGRLHPGRRRCPAGSAGARFPRRRAAAGGRQRAGRAGAGPAHRVSGSVAGDADRRAPGLRRAVGCTARRERLADRNCTRHPRSAGTGYDGAGQGGRRGPRCTPAA